MSGFSVLYPISKPTDLAELISIKRVLLTLIESFY